MHDIAIAAIPETIALSSGWGSALGSWSRSTEVSAGYMPCKESVAVSLARTLFETKGCKSGQLVSRPV